MGDKSLITTEKVDLVRSQPTFWISHGACHFSRSQGEEVLVLILRGGEAAPCSAAVFYLYQEIRHPVGLGETMRRCESGCECQTGCPEANRTRTFALGRGGGGTASEKTRV